MNIEYLTKEILPVREQEIKDGKNAATRQPLYVVLDLVEHLCSDHSDYSMMLNLKGVDAEFGYIDTALDTEDQEFCETEDGMENGAAVTRFYTDRFVAFFLTRAAAEDYLKYQSHNLTGGYVYVFYTGYRNHQMDNLFKGEV